MVALTTGIAVVLAIVTVKAACLWRCRVLQHVRRFLDLEQCPLLEGPVFGSTGATVLFIGSPAGARALRRRFMETDLVVLCINAQRECQCSLSCPGLGAHECIARHILALADGVGLQSFLVVIGTQGLQAARLLPNLRQRCLAIRAFSAEELEYYTTNDSRDLLLRAEFYAFLGESGSCPLPAPDASLDNSNI